MYTQKKEPHVRIMLLFKIFYFLSNFFFIFKSHLSKSRSFFFFFNLSPFYEYHHQLEITASSASQEYIVLNKIFLQNVRQRTQNFTNKITFWSEFRLETNHAVKNFRCLEFKSFQEYKKKQAPSQSTQVMFNLFIHNYMLQLLNCIENQRKPNKCSFFAFIICIG